MRNSLIKEIECLNWKFHESIIVGLIVCFSWIKCGDIIELPHQLTLIFLLYEKKYF